MKKTHRQTREAFLVEIKPRSFQFHPQLRLRQRVAENFISRENLDWKFKIVYDDEIMLTSDQLEQFEQCFQLNSRSAWKTWFDEYSRKQNQFNPTPPAFASENNRIQFLMFGITNSGRQCKWRKHP